jgi:hypothetical protein
MFHPTAWELMTVDAIRAAAADGNRSAVAYLLDVLNIEL